MTVIAYESDADVGVLDGTRVAVVGSGNQGRPWALNLRDSGIDVQVCVRADEWDAEADAGFATFVKLKDEAVGPAVAEFERDLRRRLGQGVGR